jgi:polyisoprenoid-binding protein YceI
MKKLLLASAAMGAVTLSIMAFRTADKPVPGKIKTAPATENAAPRFAKWALDKGHSNVKFTVTHMVVSEVDGTFKLFDGSMEHSKPDYSDAKIAFTVDVSSVNTDNTNRDNHLKSDDFFNATQFPQMKFESTSFTPLGNNKYKLDGNLTIRDVTKPVSFDVNYGGSINTQRGSKAGFKAVGKINRFDYNLKWDRATETGGLVVGKEVVITVNAQLNEVK